jgi:hypothetical protein
MSTKTPTEAQEGAEGQEALEIVSELELAAGEFVAPSARGSLEAVYSRDLTEADVAALELPRAARPTTLARIHSSHHALARCLATGMRPQQAALVTGYSPSRISALSGDPLFQQLVAEYQAEVSTILADFGQRMRDLSLDAIELLHERLLEKPAEFTTGMLLDVVKATADRTGFGTNQNVTHSFNLPTIDRPPRESHEDWKRRRTKELELKPLDQLEPPAKSVN